jgi:hypothetical protein
MRGYHEAIEDNQNDANASSLRGSLKAEQEKLKEKEHEKEKEREKGVTYATLCIVCFYFIVTILNCIFL